MAIDGSKKSHAAASQPPHKINVQKFAESRATELESLHLTVASRLNNDFRSQRNKRRRTTAFDNKLAKKRYRKRQKLGIAGKSNAAVSENEDKTAKVPRCIRRRLELRMNPESGFCTSGDGTKRLRTHVWHAKRFTMTKQWGFHLPLGLQGRGRGSRALLRWFKQGGLIHDASYNVAIQLEGPEDSLTAILQIVLVPSPSALSDDVSDSVLSGVTYGTAILHHVGAPPSRAIAPVTYIWQPHRKSREDGNGHNAVGYNEPHETGCPPNFRQLWLWIHASALTEGFDALNFACQKLMSESGIVVNCFSREGQLAKLELIGSKAFQLLKKIVHPANCISEDFWQLKKCLVTEVDGDSDVTSFFTFENEEQITSCAVIPLTIKDPRSLPDKRTAAVPEQASTNDMPKDQFKEHKGSGGLSDNKSLWDSSGGSGISPPMEEHVFCMEKHRQRMDLFCLYEPKPATLKTSRSCPLVLLKNNKKEGLPIGWSVILPLSWVKVLWVFLVSKGARPIGLREKRWIASEIVLPYFPSDFPDCNAYSSFMENEAASCEQKAEQRPSALRPFRVPIPPPWNVVCVAFDGLSERLHDIQISIEKKMVDGNLLTNSRCEISGVASVGYFNSFDGIVARTSSMLTDFLNGIHADRLLLFPLVPNRQTSLLKFMKNENMLGENRNRIAQINHNHKLCYLRVHLQAYKEGVFEEGAIVCAPCVTDIALWTSSLGRFEGKLEMCQSSVKSYFKQKSSGEWELQVSEDPSSRESHRWPIGFVTTGFVRGSKKPVAVAFCEAVLLAFLREEQWKAMPVKRRRKEIYVLVRNVRSSAYRLALATIVLEQQENDVQFM